MSNARIKTPGQVDIACTALHGPNAHPVAMHLNTPDGPRLVTWGGLSKLEWMAGMVASSVGVDDLSPEEIVERAKHILAQCAECERGQNGTTTENAENK
jgi:hypothetical protein